MKQEQTQQIEQKVTIAPEVQAHLAPLLDTYHELLIQADLINDQLDIEKAKIWKEMELFGVTKLELSNVRAAEHRGETTSYLDKLKFVALGGSLQMLENATLRKPKKAYVKIERTDRPRKKKDEEE